jgi:GT2 family glycosyltransferase
MVKTVLFSKAKGFDERYFVYYEELDFSKRIFNLGYRTKYIAESQAFHKGGGASEKVKAKRLYYNLQSRIIYSFKNFGKVKGFFIMFITLIIEPFTRLVFLILKKGGKEEVFELFSGYKMLFKNSQNIIEKGFKK